MNDLLHFTLLVIGTTYVTSMSTIFSPVRRALARVSILRSLVYCPSCTGFWWGVVLYFAGFAPTEFADVPTHSWVQSAAVSGVVSLAIANLWHMMFFKGGNDAYEAEQVETNAAQTTEKTDV